MKIKILQGIYNSIPLTMFRPKSLKYNANCKKLGRLHSRLYENLSTERINEIEQYISLIDEQSLQEQQQSFYVGVAVGIGFKKEVETLLKRKGIKKCL